MPGDSIQTVAVLGAGAAGLVTARELIRAGFTVDIFEQSHQVGGQWVYSPDTESDPLGLEVDQRLHSSLYQSLRTNLPRDLMAFADYPFDSSGGGDDSWQRFPHHSKVMQYLQKFAQDFDLTSRTRFNHQINQLQHNDDSSITLHWQREGASGQDTFDAVAVCNGHFSEPRVPQLANMAAFSGRQIHSHNYRGPADFRCKRVAVFGIAASGADIAREIASEAEQVIWCGDAFNALEGEDFSDPVTNNLHYYSCPTGVGDNGELLFKKNPAAVVDVLVYATGYHYDYPFLRSAEVDNRDNYLAPLYHQIMPVAHRNIGLIGVPFLVVPFPLFEIQARWFAQALRGSVSLPNDAEMFNIIHSREARLEQEGRRPHHYHQLGDELPDYLNGLLAEIDAPPVADWFFDLFTECRLKPREHPTTFRDADYINQGPTVIKA